MEKLLIATLALCMVLLGGANAAFAEQACSQRTLLGSYLFYATGFGKDGKPVAYAGIDYYDGKGGIIWTTTYSNGQSRNGVGSYHVDKNCRAEATYSSASKNAYFIDPSGNELVWVATGGFVTAGPEKRVSGENLVGRK